MLRTVEAVIDERGDVRLLEAVRLPGSRRALVTILEQDPRDTRGPKVVRTGITETALLSEAALAEDWLRREEDEAWEHLQREAGGPAPRAGGGARRGRRSRQGP